MPRRVAFGAKVLLGRHSELESIEALLARARSGEGGALVVVGEPGIGKTALLGAAGDMAHGMSVTAVSGVESEAKLPFAALGEIAMPFVDRLSELPAPQRDALGAALALTPPAGAPGDRLAIFAGFVGLLDAEARDRPVLVLVDDAHWLDLASAECLGYAARRLDGRRVALVAAYRDGEQVAALRGRIGTELHLSGLDRDDALALLRAQAGDLASPTAEALLELAVGNPLALIELPTALSEAQRRGRAPLEPTPAPGGALGEALERRVEATGDDARAVLLVAAASMDRSLATVVGACRQLGLDEGALERAESERLIELDGDGFAFAHPLLRGVVYRGAAPAERRRAHRALADNASEDAQAWHLAEATVGPDEEVATALEAAANRAIARGALAPAADTLERAAGLSEDAGARARRLYAAGLAAGLGGAYERAAALLEPAEQVDDPVQRASIRHLLAMVTLIGANRQPITNYELLVEEAARIEAVDPDTAAGVHADAGLTAVVAGRCGLALASAERAMATLPGDAPAVTRCQVRAMLGMGRALAGRVGEAREALDEAAELLGEVDPLTPAAASIGFALGGRLSTGQASTLRSELLGLIEMARESGTRGLLPYDQLLAAHAAYQLGDWAAAEGDADEAVAIADDSGQRGPLSIALVIRARIHAARGRGEEARRLATRGLELAEAGYGSTMIWARAMLGFLELGQGQPAAAIEELEQARDLSRIAELEDRLIVPWAPDLVEAYARAGRAQEARSLAVQLAEDVEPGRVPLAMATAQRCLGIVAEGDFEDRFERALVLHREAEAPFELGRTLLAYGARLHRARRRVAARKRLREAHDLFDGLGAQPWTEQAAAELRAAGAIERASVADPDELTAQEIRVARAVARGATNREVAAELFLSPKTIEFHLGRVYRKLGIHSRTELAAMVAEGRVGDGALAG